MSKEKTPLLAAVLTEIPGLYLLDFKGNIIATSSINHSLTATIFDVQNDALIAGTKEGDLIRLKMTNLPTFSIKALIKTLKKEVMKTKTKQLTVQKSSLFYRLLSMLPPYLKENPEAWLNAQSI